MRPSTPCCRWVRSPRLPPPAPSPPRRSSPLDLPPGAPELCPNEIPVSPPQCPVTSPPVGDAGGFGFRQLLWTASRVAVGASLLTLG